VIADLRPFFSGQLVLRNFELEVPNALRQFARGDQPALSEADSRR